MKLRPLRWWDLAAAAEIERDSFGADGWTEAVFWSELAQSGTHCYLAAPPSAGAEGITGYAGLASRAGEAYVQTLAVRRNCWGRGLGTALLSALLGEADRRGAAPVLLEVRVDNDRAQSLYRRFGFVEIGRRRRYYQPSGTDAVVMRRG